MSKSRKSVEAEEEIPDEAEILGKNPSQEVPGETLEKPPEKQTEKPKRLPPPPQDQMRRRRIGNLIKCPHCEVVLHVDKTYPDTRTRRLHCLNDQCPKFVEKKKRYSRTVSMVVQNESGEDLGVMSARQRDHLPRKDNG